MIPLFNKIFRTLFLFCSLLHINNGFAQLKHQNKLIPGIEKYSLIIKFQQNAITDIIKNKPLFTDSLLQIYPNINRTFDTYSFKQVLPVKNNSEISTLKNKKFDINKFKGLVYVKEAALLPKDKVLELAKYFEKYSFVEYASLRPKFNKPPPPPLIASSNFTMPIIKTFSPYSVTTPDFTSLQGYLQDYVENDVYGIDIEYAWSLGIYGQGVKAADIEWGFDYNHEDLISPNFVEHIEGADHTYDYHGTAVCGVLIGKDNGFGITGAVHQLDVLYGLSHYAYQGSELAYRPEFTILEAITKLNEGDVLILEMQSDNFDILDIDQSIWDIIKEATDSGIIVILAAGNGRKNLDGPTYDDYRNRGDNGAIIVGAGTRQGRNTVFFQTLVLKFNYRLGEMKVL